MAIATLASPYINRVYGLYVKKLGGPKPEARLPHLVLLSWLVPIGLFWFAWTADPSIHWASCILSGIPFGIGFVVLSLGITSYLIDCYGKYAASALAANAILRSLFGAGFPLFLVRCTTNWVLPGQPPSWALFRWLWHPCLWSFTTSVPVFERIPRFTK